MAVLGSVDPAIIVLIIAAAAVVLFVTEKVPPDLVAILVLLALAVTRVLTPQEAIAGFSNPATLTILAMFVLSAAVVRTGVVSVLANRLHRLGSGRETKMILVIALIVGPASAFMNNTAAVAIMIPLVVSLAVGGKRSPSRFLIPLSYAAQMGGVLTLIGTSTNILASEISVASGHRRLDMFEFTAAGAVIFAVGLVYLLLIAPRLLPHRGKPEEDFAPRFNARLIVQEGASVIGTLASTRDAALRLGGDVVLVLRAGHKLLPREATVQAGDIVEVEGTPPSLLQAEAGGHFLPVGIQRFPKGLTVEEGYTVVEVVVSPGSSYVGPLTSLRRLAESDAYVMGIHRKERIVPAWFAPEVEAGDTLMLMVQKARLAEVRDSVDLILVQEVPKLEFRRNRLPHIIVIFGAVISLAALNVFPIVVTALAGAAACVLTGVITMREFYKAIRLDVVVLLAGLVPLGTAIVKTGGANALADVFIGVAPNFPPWALLFGAYVATGLLTEVLSNNATVVLMVPVVVATAIGLGLDPTPFVLAVAYAASTSFMTPVGYQTNTMVYGPGGYRFSDFFRVGAPLNLILAIVTTAVLTAIYGL